MSRAAVENWAIEMLRDTQARATCDRGRCAALSLKDGRILAGGYVGSPRGMPHCDEAGHEFQESWVYAETLPDDVDDFYEPHSGGYLIKKKSCIRTIHAEQNAIAWAAREGIALKDTRSRILAKRTHLDPFVDAKSIRPISHGRHQPLPPDGTALQGEASAGGGEAPGFRVRMCH